jgi:uncharacterized SAM-binding protein YcdF (DUF218 family)
MRTLRKAGRAFYRLLAVIGLTTVLVISTPVVSWWVRAYSGPGNSDSSGQPKGDVLILLSAAADEQYGGISYSSYWRARQALFAWQTGGFRKIVICGSGGPGIFNFLIADGVPREVFVTERGSASTRENAIETARLIQTLPGKKVLLTSDFHMYRALRVFRKLGIEAAPMAVPDVLHSTEHWYERFSAFETMATETVKIVYYAVRGWI